MRIGQNDNFLSIEASSLAGGYASYRIEAVASASGRRFTAFHDGLMLDSSESVTRQFADFEDFKSQRVEIPMTENGWLRLERDARGYLTVRYRIEGWKASAAMEGKVMVEGEFAGSFCREFGALLREDK